MTPGAGLLQYGPWDGLHLLNKRLVWCLRNNYAFVALKWAWGEARGRDCIRSDTRTTEQRSPRPISAQPEGRHVFWAEALLLAPHRSTSGYALVPVRKHLAPSLRPKSIAANVSLFRRHHTSFVGAQERRRTPLFRIALLHHRNPASALIGENKSRFGAVQQDDAFGLAQGSAMR